MNHNHSSGNARKYRLTLSAVHMVYRLVNSTYNVKELSLRLTRLLCQFIKAHSASVFILEPAKNKIALIATFNNKINILYERKQDFNLVCKKELKVNAGYTIFEKHLLGLPLVADENLGAIFLRRSRNDPPFTEFDKELLSVFVEQAVTAIKNLQLYEEQQRTILSSIKFIAKLLEKQPLGVSKHTPLYFHIMKALAEKLNVGQEGIKCLYYASVLRQAGAMDVPYQILSKTSQLTPEEFKVLRDLPSKSAALIRPVEFLRPVLPIILYHREKYDGTGYPSGLKKEQIPLGARIMAVVDALEAMIKGRPYKRKLTTNETLEEIKQNSGTQFDPRVVKAFSELYRQKKFRNHLSRIK
jgi:HD-GYP domain-containing protein (c-di-GMP phosphodiesterase class II)